MKSYELNNYHNILHMLIPTNEYISEGGDEYV